MRVVMAITGATGAVYGITLLRELARAGVETHLVYSKWARRTIELETGYKAGAIDALAARVYNEDDLAAPISSGSFKHEGMVIAPCSMKTLSALAAGYADNLISRAADVTLKEKRRLVLLPRETPLHEIHLENMLRLARAGAVIMPPVPAFYHRPTTITDLVLQTVGRVMDLLNIENNLAPRWQGG
ncbi:UbiX family flavin prenyltransferase [Desulfallas sp. Bu1-1]|jgi:4-hydroxy-3-polyprenylbenzoate decarboxylase|uniref:UbiX family flavin prenyltransferase n=1 Tax=Desulfallas sp. Bu1-1 TaxID=2787620 RepID=UPI0018A0781E|nr:UbiX family flavin prenyltransferase [Desulfallas sp. Bu1-1]MBF7082630.1 UbiX family flavin prenyltransferase [Desulfallas sp. Bu1-1]